MDAVLAGGIAPERIVVDPGLGFSKDAEHDLALLAHLDRLRAPRPPAAGRRLPQAVPRPCPGRPGGRPAARPRARRRHRRRLRPRRPRGRLGGARARGTRHRRRGTGRPRRRKGPGPSPVSAPHTDVEQVEAPTPPSTRPWSAATSRSCSLWLTLPTWASTRYHDPADRRDLLRAPRLAGAHRPRRGAAVVRADHGEHRLHPVLPHRRARSPSPATPPW